MRSRRRFLVTIGATSAGMFLSYAKGQVAAMYTTHLPFITGAESTAIPLPSPEPTPSPSPELWPSPAPGPVPVGDDMPILGAASGTFEEAHAWLSTHTTGYSSYDVTLIVDAYRMVAESVGMDWFMAIAQMAHETGNLTSFWSQRPQRNPAGIGVDGSALDGWPGEPPPQPTGWSYNTQRNRWEKGISFPSWMEASVPAHLGRLLAYALRDEWANDAQYQLIQQALAWRPLPAEKRGVALSYVALNGKWAVPGTTYGQTIIALARRMRGMG